MKASRKLALTIVLTSLITVASACGGGGGDGKDGSACADLNLKVFGGEACNFSRSPVVAIVGFDAAGQPAGVCSATMVTVNDAVTAAHCAGLTLQPGGVALFADGVLHRIIAGANHPFYDGRVDSPYDVAMLTIESVLDIGPVPLLVSNPLAVEEDITVFGYGRNEETGFRPQAEDFRAGFMQISRLTPFQFTADFNSTGSAICQGDSGGPATQTIDGVTHLVGITSFTFNGCESNSVSGFVNVQNPEIFQFIQNYAPDVTVR